MKYTLVAISILFTSLAFGQVTFESNAPAFNRYVGFDNSSGIVLPIENRGFPEIDISSSGRTKFAITEQPNWLGLGGLDLDSVQRTTMGLQGEQDTAWSILHLWSGPLTSAMQRSWMNVGTTMIANQDLMYTGLPERPTGSGNRTDAVIARGCQDGATTADNFRFIFLQPNANSANQGTEMMRIAPWGNVGIGDSFSNNLQPHRRTVVHERTDSAQFRIAWGVDPNPVLGQHADFQVTNNGNLHIKPSDRSQAFPSPGGATYLLAQFG